MRFIDPDGMLGMEAIEPGFEERIKAKHALQDLLEEQDRYGNDPEKKKQAKKEKDNPTSGLAAGWAIALGEPTPFGEVIMGVATAGAILY